MHPVFSMKPWRALREFSRYFLVSLLALLADMGLMLLLAKLIYYLLAVVIGFLGGALLHYALSVTFVFERRKLLTRRTAELSFFVMIGVVALLINVGVVYAGVEWAGLALPLAKLAAAGCSFLFGYGARKLSLF